MMNTGIIRKFDRNGRLVIPKEIRDNLGYEHKTPAEMFIFRKGIYIQEYIPGCNICGEVENTVSYKNHNFCEECLKEIKSFK